MPRRPWILWLMLALLPLRGFAAGWMPAQQSAQVVMQLGAAAPDVAPPCHDTDSGPSACCTLCDLCHGAAAAATSAGPMLATLPRLAVRQAPARDTGRQPLDLLERPPRTFGA
jgi:cytochrome c553